MRSIQIIHTFYWMCDDDAAAFNHLCEMPVYVDQLKRTIEIIASPQRIVSLVPSQTELLADLGLEKEVTGITKFCIHPHSWFKDKPRIGGTKTVDIEKIKSLQPDLIIANKEENVREQIEALAGEFPVWISDVNTLHDALSMISALGEITNRLQEAISIKVEIEKRFSSLTIPASKLRTAYLIWKDPYMTVGGDTFIHDMLTKTGFENIFSDQQRYPAITVDAIANADCQVLLLSSEPYPFKQKHIDELQAHLPRTKIILVDGEMFSWYGSRLLQAPAYFQSLHKEIKSIV